MLRGCSRGFGRRLGGIVAEDDLCFGGLALGYAETFWGAAGCDVELLRDDVTSRAEGGDQFAAFGGVHDGCVGGVEYYGVLIEAIEMLGGWWNGLMVVQFDVVD